MSKLEELINKLCPNGVEYKTLENVTKEINIGINPRKFFKLNPENAVGYYVTVRELNGLNGVLKTDKTDLINQDAINIIQNRANIENGDILFSNTGTVGKLALITNNTKDFGVNEGIYIIKPLNYIINSRFLYYYLDSRLAYNEYSKMFTGSTLKHITQKALLSLALPVPPMEVQNEIVHILDDFTLLSAELSAELKARQKQYEFYKNKLLKNYENINKNSLKEIAEYSKERINASELNENNYVGVDNLLQNKMGKTISSHIPNAGNSTKYTKGDILIGNIRPYLKKIWFADNDGGTNGDVLDIHITSKKILPEYLYYILSSDCFFEYDNNNSKGAKMPRGDKKSIMNYRFYLPSIEEQEKIINILKKFEKLCNSILIGLPAEIEKRQKQYEYYRDKLLTFKELKVEN